MDMKENDDRLVKQFLMEHKTEVLDMGFTRRVIRHLPTPINWLSRLWSVFCLVVGIVMAVAFGAMGSLRALFSSVVGDAMGAVLSDGLMLHSTLLFVGVVVVASVAAMVNRLVSMN